nr:serine/threonine-protein phosphatase 6 regulatory ankyrin repeat subunit C-like [Procambarus clarkii]
MGGKTVLLVVAALTVLSLRVQADIDADGFAAERAMAIENTALALSLIDNNIALANWTDSDGMTLLHLACFYSLPTVVQELVNLGANKEARLPSVLSNMTPLLAASFSQCIDCLNILIDAKSDVNAQDMYGQTPLMKILASGTSWTSGTVDLLVSAGANINIQDETGGTAVMFAAPDGASALPELLAYCPDLTLTDNNGMTALMHMTNAGNTVNAALIQAKLDNMCSFGNTNYSLGAVRSENCTEMVCLTNCKWNNTGIVAATCTTTTNAPTTTVHHHNPHCHRHTTHHQPQPANHPTPAKHDKSKEHH